MSGQLFDYLVQREVAPWPTKWGELGRIKSEYAPKDPPGIYRLKLYSDGEAYMEGLELCFQVSPLDPMHPLNPMFNREFYLEKYSYGKGRQDDEANGGSRSPGSLREGDE